MKQNIIYKKFNVNNDYSNCNKMQFCFYLVKKSPKSFHEI